MLVLPLGSWQAESTAVAGRRAVGGSRWNFFFNTPLHPPVASRLAQLATRLNLKGFVLPLGSGQEVSVVPVFLLFASSLIFSVAPRRPPVASRLAQLATRLNFKGVSFTTRQWAVAGRRAVGGSRWDA